MGFFSKSKKKNKATNSYVPPDIEEKDDSSDDDMLVLDFSKTKESTDDTNTSKENENDEKARDSHASTSESMGFITISKLEGAENVEVEVSKSNDTKDIQSCDYRGSKMEADSESAPNEHLEQLRLKAEEGPVALRALLFCSVLGMCVTSIAVVNQVMYLENNNFSAVLPHIVISIFNIFFGAIILVVQCRRLTVSGPVENGLWEIRGQILRYLGFLRFVWGRGVFCFVLGLLHVIHDSSVTTVSGVFLSLVGLMAFLLGLGPAKQFERARHSMTDGSKLLLDFNLHDLDKDGYIDMEGFSSLVMDQDLDMDSQQIAREFSSIDKDQDGKISFNDFKRWMVEEAWSFERTGCGHMFA